MYRPFAVLLSLLVVSVASAADAQSPTFEAGDEVDIAGPSIASESTSPTRKAPTFKAPILVSATRPVFGEWDMEEGAGGTMIIGWIDVGSGVGCGFTTSTDGGQTWSVPSVMLASANSGGDPVISFDKDGMTVYRSCILTPTGGKPDGTWYEKSTDGGLTWDTTTRRAVVPFDDYQWAATDEGDVWQIYNQGDTGFRTSTDEGVTWSSSRQISDGWPSCIQYSNGVLYGISGQESQPLMFFTSADRGVTWTKKQVNSELGGGRAECAIDASKNTIYVISPQGGNGVGGQGPTTAIRLFRSKDLGVTWDPPVTIFNPATSNDYADIALGPGGSIHVSWMDERGGFNQAYYSESTDGGNTWLAPIKVSTHTSLGGAQYIHYGKGIAVTPSGVICVGYPAGGSTSSSTSMYAACTAAPPPAVIARIGVAPATASITADQTQQFTATAYDANNISVNATFGWTATGGAVSTTGLFTPQAVGTFSVTATASGKSGNGQVTVTHGAAVTLSVSPQGPTITADQTLRFSAEETDAKGNKWALSNPTWSVAGTGAGMIDSTGIYTPSKTGTFTVTGADPSGSPTGTSQVTVTPGAVYAISVLPATAQITADDTQTFTASATDSNGNPVPSVFSWTTTGGGVSSSGVYTPDKVGTYTVTASTASKSAVAQVVVTPGALARLDVTPKGATVRADQTQQYSVVGYDAHDNVVTGTKSWSVDDGAISATGLFEPMKVGNWKVTAKQSAISETVNVIVVPGAVDKLTITPASVVMDYGRKQQFTLKAEDVKGNEIPQDSPDATVTWKLVGDNIGKLSDTGELTATWIGGADVVATMSYLGAEKTATAKVTAHWYLLYIILVAAIAATLIGIAVGAGRRRKRREKERQQQMMWAQPSYESGPMLQQ